MLDLLPLANKPIINMKTEVRTITPEIAKQLLGGNSRNRPLRKGHAERLAEEMRAGKWVLNGVPIIFNGKLLIDGQHRLVACVKANRSFDTLVVSDVAPDSFLTIDVGAKRTAADTLATKGEKHYAALAAAATIVSIYDSGKMGERMTTAGGNNRTVAEAMKRYIALRHSVEHCVPMSTKIIPVSILSASHYIFSRIDSVKADGFIDRLATGINVQKDTPMSSLRDSLIENYTSARKHTRGYIFSLVIKAWNAERTDKLLKRLRGWTGESNESFPIAI